MINKAYETNDSEKHKPIKAQNHLYFITLITLFFLIFLFISDYSPLNYYQPKSVFPNSIHTQNTKKSCSGRYIYMHDLPPKFNLEILENCSSLYIWYNMCPCVQNSGFGPEIIQNSTEDWIFGQKGSWFSTDQFFLEVIFHNRMKRYDCLTNDSYLASAVYVPFYGGLDLGRHLWNSNATVIDSLGIDLVKWLVEKPEWKKLSGGDHFFVAGRIARDYRRIWFGNFSYGGNLMGFPESKNLTMLTIESTSSSNEIAIPYPTHFHPETQHQITEWQNRVLTRKRKYLFAFSGAPRPNIKDSVRGELISQCLAMEKDCKLLNCTSDFNKCNNPVEVMKVFEDSDFCLQPPGDSYTRRSTFDSIIAGCIPVFFNEGSAYVQYLWYLPKDYRKYSVFIPENLVKNGSVSINETLMKVSGEERRAMREDVIRLIPKITYVNPFMDRVEMEKVEDAFDIAVKRVLERIQTKRRNPAI